MDNEKLSPKVELIEFKPKGFLAQFRKTVNNVPTEFVFQPFCNYWFLIITQHSGIPNLYVVQFDTRMNNTATIIEREPINHPELHTSVPIDITNKFGADTNEIRGSIQFLVNKTNLRYCPTALLIGFSLKEYNASNLQEIVKVLHEIIP